MINKNKNYQNRISIVKNIVVIILFTPMIFSTIISCGQSTTGRLQKKPVALGVIYQIPEEEDGIVPNTNPAMQKSTMTDYILQMEWHFEMRFTNEERSTYEKIIIEMWNESDRLRTNINGWVKNIRDVKVKDWFGIFMDLSSRTHSDIIDCGMEGLLSNWSPTSLRGGIKKAAKNGDKECIFLWNKITNYETPIIEGKVFVSKFTQLYIDAAAEWITYKINVVANKEFLVLDEGKREQMKTMILEAWKKEESEKKIEYEHGNVQAMLMQASTNWNTLRLTKKYSLNSYITNYNKLSTLADWAREVVFYCPSVKPFAEERIKEYSNYAANMGEAEWKVEFQRLNMQANLNKEAFQQMKNDMVRSHVMMLNIIEGSDRWEVKNKTPY
jgi:hypothetical protein